MNEQRSHCSLRVESPMNAKSPFQFIPIVTSLAIVFVASLAIAQTPQAPSKEGAAPAAKPAGGGSGKEAKKTSVNFEDQLIEGQTQKPELFYLLQNRNNNFKRLIKLRENFLPEMRKTAEDVGRKDSTAKGSGE